MQDTFEVTVRHRDGFRFEVDFHEGGRLFTDEPAPLGSGSGPNPARLVVAAAANCLSASLLFCLQRFKVEVTGMTAVAQGHLVRNAHGRWRIGSVDVSIVLDTPAPPADVERCTEIFRDDCTVTESLTQGFPVHSVVVTTSDNLIRAALED